MILRRKLKKQELIAYKTAFMRQDGNGCASSRENEYKNTRLP